MATWWTKTCFKSCYTKSSMWCFIPIFAVDSESTIKLLFWVFYI